MSFIQALHDREFNGGLAWPEDGKILVYLGCPLDPPPRQRMFGEALVASFVEAQEWLRERARHHGETLQQTQEASEEPIVQRLFEAGIPGSVTWVYDGAFGMTLGPRQGGASSWAEAETWLSNNAPLGAAG
jgi:hypothetical protein